MPHGGECAFNRVGGPQVLPMLRREVVKRQQRLAVLRQATHRLVVLDGVGLDKGIESGVGVVLRLGHPDVLQRALGLRLLALRQPIEHIGHLVHPSSADRGSWATPPRWPARSSTSWPKAKPQLWTDVPR